MPETADTAALIAAAHRFLAASLADDHRGAEDPDDPATVQAMQIALHIPKADPPQRNDALVAAAQAAAAVCLDPRAGEESAWRDALAQWYGHRIRKIARRARGAAWENVQTLPGCTFRSSATGPVAEARAFIPSAVGEVPHAISKLQIKGTDLPHDDLPAPNVGDIEMSSVPVILVDDSLAMTAGKAAAQVGHGSMLLAAQMNEAWAVRWALDGFPLAVREVPRELIRATAALPASVPVRDSGFTEVAPGSVTVVAHPGAYSAEDSAEDFSAG